ncbi:MAG: methyltransferase domain-containing protein [Gemmatimonadales bacterium]
MSRIALDDTMRRAVGWDRAAVVREYRALARLAAAAPPVLDLGCGSGPLLDTLRALGVPAQGVDASEAAVRACRDRGLDVAHGDLLAFLRTANGARWGTIAAAHIVEHLPVDAAREVFALVHRALRPGGRFLVLTPNPRNLYVAGEGFWTDPTHVRPYPAPLLEALALDAGFTTMRVRGWWGGMTARQKALGVLRWLGTGGLHQAPSVLLAVATT